MICTQAATHRESPTVPRAGKHVLVEKPLTIDVAEADELTSSRTQATGS